jgi:HK97 family phage prohead protease
MSSQNASIEHRAIRTADGVRFQGEEGTFAGYAMLWDTVDSYGTRFASGAFTAGGLDTNPYPLLWLHEPEDVLGVFTAVEDENGLWIEGRYDDTIAGRDARTRAMTGSAPELSVGFSRTSIDPEDPELITGAKLYEVSQITARHASVPDAEFAQVRAGIAVGTAPDEVTEALVLTKAGAALARLRLSRLGR